MKKLVCMLLGLVMALSSTAFAMSWMLRANSP